MALNNTSNAKNQEKELPKTNHEFDHLEHNSQTNVTDDFLDSERKASNEPTETVKIENIQTSVNPINNPDSILVGLQRQLTDYRRKLKDKEDLLNDLKEKVEDLDQQNFNLQEDNNKLSDEMMEYVYENELLTKKCSDYETKMKTFTFVSDSTIDNSSSSKDTSIENVDYQKSMNGDYRPEISSQTSQTMTEQLASEKNSCLEQISNFENLNNELKIQINKYEISKKDCVLKLEELSKRLSVADEKNREYVDIIEKLALSKTSLEDQLNEARDRINVLEKSQLREEPNNELVEKEISLLKEQLSDLVKEKNIFEEERHVFMQIEKELTEDVQDARSKVTELEKKKIEWESVILQSEEDIVKLKEQVTELQEQLLRTQVEKDATDEKLVQIKEQTKNAFESQIDDHIIVISSLEKKNEKFKIELEENQTLLELIKNQLNEKTTELEHIRSESEDNAMLTADMNRLINEKELCEKAVIDCREQIENLTKTEKELQISLKDYEASNIKLKTENQNLIDETNSLEIQVKGLIETNQGLIKDNENALDANISLKSEINNLKEEREHLEDLYRNLKEINENQLREIESLKETNSRFEKQLAELQLECSKDENALAETKKECSTLKLSLDDTKEQVQKLQEEYENLKLSTSKTCNNLLELQTERDALLETKDQLKIEFERKLTEEYEHNMNELENARSQNTELKEKLESLSLEKDELQQALDRSAELELKFQEEIKTLQQKVEEIDELEKARAELRRENENMNLQIKNYETEIQCHHKKIATLTTTYKNKFDEANAKLDKLTKELAEQKVQLDQKRVNNEHLNMEILSKDAANKLLFVKLESKIIEIYAAHKEKKALIKQLQELENDHLVKSEEYEQQISKLKLQIEEISSKKEANSRHAIRGGERQVIKTLLGENDESKLENQALTAELKKGRKLTQSNRKVKRYRNHDKSRSLDGGDCHDVEIITTPNDNYEDQVKELAETEKMQIQKDLDNLMLKIKQTEMCKETAKVRHCDQCMSRSYADVAEKHSEDDYIKLQEQCEDLKKICKLKNSRISTLQNQLLKKENGIANLNGK